jgi:nucleotide-binding universal stress UspA family protein
MICLNRILLPIDYSARCLAVTRSAIALAERFGSEITALRVLVPVADADRSTLNLTDEFLADRRQKAEARLRSFIERQRRDIQIAAVIREGNPAIEILSQAAKDKSDLLIMPTYGFSAFRVLLLGSVTARCLHQGFCPVWTGPHKSPIVGDESPLLGHIACAVALGAERSRGLEWAASLATAFRSGLTVLHLAPRVHRPNGSCSTPWRCHVVTDDFTPVPHFLEPRLQPGRF